MWMRVALVAAALALTLARPAQARQRRHRPRPPPSSVVLDGAPVPVRWTDGDTFRFLGGEHRGRSARLVGYNTLESYGPVHRWGGWTRRELLDIARAAGPVAGSRERACTTSGAADRYRRLLVSCPVVAAELVETGLAMVYAVGAPADPELLALQHVAQRRRAGMWAKGVPATIVTGVHSAAENGTGTAYNRLVDTRTGITHQRQHARSYWLCEDVCAGAGADRSCMTYVPFERRHRGRPACLRDDGPRRSRGAAVTPSQPPRDADPARRHRNREAIG